MKIKKTIETEGQQEADTSISCPVCHQQEIYRLADGRCKCKQCKKKFSLKRTRSRISPDILKAISVQFWEMKTAEQCAQALSINRKTAQSYYSKIRDYIAKDNAKALEQIKVEPITIPTSPEQQTIFWFVIELHQIRIIFPETPYLSLRRQDLPTVQGASEIYTHSTTARKNIILDKFYRRTLWAGEKKDENLLQNFWRYAKINLMRYRGGCKSNFPHFITEMAFRFNRRVSEGTIQLLFEELAGSASET